MHNSGIIAEKIGKINSIFPNSNLIYKRKRKAAVHLVGVTQPFLGGYIKISFLPLKHCENFLGIGVGLYLG